MIVRLYIDYGFSGVIAYRYGIYQALVINRIIWSINFHEEDKAKYAAEFFRDGLWWMNNTYQAIQDHFNGCIKAETIRKIIKKFEEDGLLIAKKMNASKSDHTKWYALNIPMWNALHSVPIPETQAISDTEKTGVSEPVQNTASGTPSETIENTEAKSKILDSIDPVQNTASSSTNSLSHSHDNIYKPRPPSGSDSHNSPCIHENQNGSQKPPSNRSDTKTIPMPIWDREDDFADVYANLVRVKSSLLSFNKDELQAELESLGGKYGLSIGNLVELSDQWQEWHNSEESRRKPRVIKLSFRTWVNNSVKWNKGNNYGSKTFKHIGEGIDWSKEDDSKPW